MQALQYNVKTKLPTSKSKLKKVEINEKEGKH